MMCQMSKLAPRMYPEWRSSRPPRLQHVVDGETARPLLQHELDARADTSSGTMSLGGPPSQTWTSSTTQQLKHTHEPPREPNVDAEPCLHNGLTCPPTADNLGVTRVLRWIWHHDIVSRGGHCPLPMPLPNKLND